MPNVVQRSFNGGELSPQLQGRADLARYGTSAGTMLNMVALPHGPATNRAGTRFVGEVKDSNAAHRFIEFIFSLDQAYVLLFGPLYMRVIRARAFVETSGVAAWSGAATYTVGDLVTQGGVTYYCVLAHGPSHIPPNGTYWYALDGDTYEIPTPYAEDDLAALQFVQSADVITIVHPDYAPRKLSRFAHTRWTLTAATFGAAVPAPSSGLTCVAGQGSGSVVTNPGGLTAVGGNGGLPQDSYKVTAWYGSYTAYFSNDYALQSPPSLVAQSTIGGADGANPVALSWTASPATIGAYYALTDYRVYKLIGGTYLLIGIIPAGTVVFSDTGLAAIVPYVSPPASVTNILTFRYVITSIGEDDGAESPESIAAVDTGVEPTAAAYNLVTWAAVPGARSYRVYREINGVKGYVGSASGTGTVEFHDPITPGSTASITPDLSQNPPERPLDPTAVDQRPAVISSTQQRLAIAAWNDSPEGFALSRVGTFYDFPVSSPVAADGAIIGRAAGRQANTVRAMIELSGTLVMLTSSGTHVLRGDQDGTYTPAKVNLRQPGYDGVAELAPLVVGESALVVRFDYSTVAEIKANEAGGFAGANLSLFSPHLFEGHTLVDSTYQKMPWSVAWYARDDGVLLGLTYVPSQEVGGWHRHETTGGTFERVCAIPEGTEYALYLLVNRAIEGVTKRYVEVMESRLVTDPVDVFFVDCGLTYDGRNADATTMTLSGGTDWTSSERLVLTRSAGTFDASEVGNAYHLTIGDVVLRCEVLTYTDATHLEVRSDLDVAVAFRDVALTDWAAAVDEVAGLDHLEGETVAMVGDGGDAGTAVVSGGAVTLARPYAVIHVGLPIVADLELLEVEDPQQQSLIGQPKLVSRVEVVVEGSLGLKVGPDEDNLQEAAWRDYDAPGLPPALATGTKSVQLDAAWKTNGRVLIRQDKPFPLTVLSVLRSVTYGDK